MSSSKPKKTSVPKPPLTALSLDDLDQQYNPNVIIPARIRAALAKLGDHAMTALNFQREANVTMTHLAQYGEQFESFQVVIRENGKAKILWCGTEEFAERVRERLGV